MVDTCNRELLDQRIGPVKQKMAWGMMSLHKHGYLPLPISKGVFEVLNSDRLMIMLLKDR